MICGTRKLKREQTEANIKNRSIVWCDWCRPEYYNLGP